MKRKILFSLTAVIILFLTPLYAQQEAEEEDGEVMSLFAIEKLIRQTDYSEALKQLNLFIEKKPDYFDNAQRLIKIIMNRRKQYSVLAEKAIKSSTENPEDHETPAKIILQMRSIEKNPPAEIKRMIDMLEEMHLFKYYAYLFDTIQEESARLSENGEYFAAIDKVRDDGFDIYKDEFYDNQIASENGIVQDYEQVLTRLNNSVDRYKDSSFHKEFDNITTQFIKAVDSSDYPAADSLFPELKRFYEFYMQIRNEIYDCGIEITKLYDQQKQVDPSITDASYLPFMQRFVLGLSTQDNSGILGAVDAKYIKNIELMKSSVERVVKSGSEKYLKALPEDILSDSVDYAALSNKNEYVSPLERFGGLGKNVNALYALMKIDEVEDDQQIYAPHPAYDISLDYEYYLSEKTAELVVLTQQYQNERRIQTELLANQNTMESAALANSLFDSVSRMSEVLGTKNSLLPSYFDWGQAYDESLALYRNSETDYVIDWSNHTKTYEDYLDRIFQESAQVISGSWDIISQSYKADADNYILTLSRSVEAANIFARGFDEPISAQAYDTISSSNAAQLEFVQAAPRPVNPVYYYPDLENLLYEHIQTSVVQYSEDLTQKQKVLSDNLNNHEDWLTNEALVQIVDSAVEYIQGVKSRLELMSMNAGLAQSENNVKLENARYAKNYADSIIEEATAAYKSGQLDKAEKLLIEASEKYSESLAIADNNGLRNEADSIKLELSTKIMDAKNELVVKQSREFYTQARDALNYDRYDDAETFINSAINKWAETHTEKNPEFEDFLELVNTAVSMKTGRVLLASDPLYSEMSQLLSIAYQYYDEGALCMQKGDKAGAETALNNAIENLNKFKSVYPLNQEASLLLLKIERLRDPARFEEEFAQKVQSAIAQSKNKDTKAQAYNTLTDYYNLNPDYKGLKDIIYNLEIELGMRQKPVDNSAAARSTRLTNQAQTQFNNAGSNTSKLNQALNTVNEALKINPNNTAAQTLKDRISLKLGSSSAIVLSSADQNLLTQAKKAYQGGNIDDANTYMLRLLNSNPDNIKVKEVSDLNNKIKSQL